MSKTLVEDCGCLRVWEFKPDMWLRTYGLIKWTRGSTMSHCVAFQVLGDQLPMGIRLMYTWTPPDGEREDHDYVVPLTRTPLAWGGVRYWFLCPFRGCGNRVACLYLPPGKGVLACRHCYGLGYSSQQTHFSLNAELRKIVADMAAQVPINDHFRGSRTDRGLLRAARHDPDP